MKRNQFKPAPRPAKKSSWEGTVCPCGGSKERETMLCPDCVVHFQKERPSLFDYLDTSRPLDWRRSSAVILVTLARGRRQSTQRNLPLTINLA